MTRKSTFVTGIETSTQPSVGTPSADTDTVTKGFSDSTYTHKDNIGGVVDDVTALKALDSSATERVDNQIYFLSTGSYYGWDSTSTTAGDDDNIVTPDDITEPAAGRWIKLSSAMTGSSTGAAGQEVLDQKLSLENVSIFTPPIANSVGSGFGRGKTEIQGYVWDDYTSGTSIYMVWDGKFLSDSDKDLDATTGWAVDGADTSGFATDAVEVKIGANSLSFDKTGTTITYGGIFYDRGSANLNINGNTDLFVWFYVPTVTNFSNIAAIIDIDTTNYETYTTTTDHTGASISSGGAGWYLLKFDLSVAGTSTGSGWTKTDLFRYFRIRQNVTSAAQTLTDCRVDGVVFSKDISSIGILGYERDIYDTSNRETMILSTASSRSAGLLTLASGLSNAYTAGTSSSAAIVKRSTLQQNADGYARMVDGLSGDIADDQYVRLERILPESLSSQNFSSTVEWNTDMHFIVTGVPGTTSFEISDVRDSTANIVSGYIFDVFEIVYDTNGKPFYASRELPLTVTSSSHLSGTTTVNNSGDNTGIAIGDLVLLRQIENIDVSLVSTSSNESFQAMTVDERLIEDTGIFYPEPSSVWAHWRVGGLSEAEATTNLKGPGVDLTVNGTLSFNNTFLNGLYGTSGWTTSNYLSIGTTDSEPISADTADAALVAFSVPFYVTSHTATVRGIISRFNGGAASGWALNINASNVLVFRTQGTDRITSGAISTGEWHHAVIIMQDGATSYMYLDGALVGTYASSNIGDSGQPFGIGVSQFNSVANPATNVVIGEIPAWRNGNVLSIEQVNDLYQNGAFAPVGNYPNFKIKASKNGLSGQKLSARANLIRTTDDTKPVIDSFGVIKSS